MFDWDFAKLWGQNRQPLISSINLQFFGKDKCHSCYFVKRQEKPQIYHQIPQEIRQASVFFFFNLDSYK